MPPMRSGRGSPTSTRTASGGRCSTGASRGSTPRAPQSEGANWDFNSLGCGNPRGRDDRRRSGQGVRVQHPRLAIINSYLAWPREDETGVAFDRDLIPSVKTDATSITAYGYRGNEAPDLIIKENFNNANTGAEECELFGEWYVDNYAEIRKAVQRSRLQEPPPR